jgi:hypothetical protein
LAKLGNFLQVTDIRGSVGGNVFSKSRNGGTLRARIAPRNPRTTDQLDVRALVTAGSREAQALASSDRDDWVTYANGLTFHNPVSGAAYIPSWMQVYMSYYVPFKLFAPGGSFPDTPPATPYSGDTITLSAAVTGDTITVTGSAQQTAGQTTFLYLEKLKSPNRTPSNRPGKLVSTSAIPATPFEIDIAGLAPGAYALKYRFVKTSTGQGGPLQSLGTFLAS